MTTSDLGTTGQLAVLPPEEEHRQFRRRPVNLAAMLEGAGTSLQRVLIRDLSEKGCRVYAEAPIEKGSILMVQLPGMEVLRATVVWSDGNEAGCVFENEFHPAAIDQAMGRSVAGQRPVVHRRGVFGRKDAEYGSGAAN